MTDRPTTGRGLRIAAAGVLAVSLTAALAAGAQPAGEAKPPRPTEVRAERRPPSVLIHAGKRVLLAYRYDKVPFKPYVKELFSPAGAQVLLDAPHDHLHHHGVMFAVSAGGVDFWSETPANGKQVHRSMALLPARSAGRGATAGVREQLDWMSPKGKCMMTEQRTVEACLAPDRSATLVTWRSRLACPPGAESVKLTGSHYFGLGMRFVRSMDRAAAFRTPKGAPGKAGTKVGGTEYVTPAPWCAVTGRAGDKPVTAAMFGHPDNKRKPVTWFTMTVPFAYLSATLNYWKEPLTIGRAEPLELCYGVAIWDGRADDAQIEKMQRLWVKRCSVTTKRKP